MMFMRVLSWAMVCTLLCSACSYQRSVRLKPTDLPEYIYRTPMQNDYMAASVGVFDFNEPPYAPGTGKVAAELLYEEILSRRVYAVVAYERGFSGQPPEVLRDVALSKDYDLIITGDVVHYLEGSDEREARVDERLRVFEVKENKILWYAKAVDVGPYAPLVDYYVVEGYGAPAPSTETLFKRNAEKFARMLLELPSQALWTKDASKEKGSWEAQHPEPSNETRRFLDVPFEGESFSAPVLEDQTQEESETTRSDSTTGGVQDRTDHDQQQTNQTGNATQDQQKVSPLSKGPDLGNVTAPIYFELDEAVLLPPAMALLDEKAEWLKSHSQVNVEIQGHCDERGPYAYNMTLGNQRAQSVKQYLSGHGISKNRFRTVSFGWQRPVDPAHDENAWAKNRRAEFVVLKK